jgi:LysR family glycine cleavage system transcriptional activator
VTPGAVSQHIKSLEDWAGAPLFERRSQGVSLTPLGATVAEQFSSAFDAMGDAVRALRTGASQSTINIAALPSVAQLWLSPRLPAIRAHLSNHGTQSARSLCREVDRFH